MALGVPGTKLKCCWSDIRSVELFSGRLDVSGLLACEF